MAHLFPNGRLIEVLDSYTLIPEGQPAKLTGHLREFISQEPLTAV